MLLKEEQHAEFLSRFADSDEQTNSVMEEESEEQSSAGVEDTANDEIEASSTSPNDTGVEEDSPTSLEEEASAIPYSRFQEVVHTRNEYREQISAMEQRVEELQRQLSSPKAAEERYETKENDEFDWLEDYDDDNFDENIAEAGAETDNRYSGLEERLYKFEVAQAQTDLEAEMASAKQEFPDVPDEIMLHAVVSDPTVSVYEVAAQYNDFVNSIQTQAISDYERKQAAPAAPPRPSVSSVPVQYKEGKPTRNMADAKTAMLRWIKQA
jgi:hypothetical protein